MTYIATVVFFVLWFTGKNKGKESKSLLTTTFMFGAASLMWSVDGIASALEGEGFFDISVEDTILGGIILVCGLAVFIFLTIMEKRRKVVNAE